MKDILGKSINQGDFIAFSLKEVGHGGLRIGIVLSNYPVEKYNTKRLPVAVLNPAKKTTWYRYKTQGHYAEPHKLMVLDPGTLPESIKIDLLEILEKKNKQAHMEKEIANEIGNV